MKEENLKELFKKVAYDEPSNNFNINIMESVLKLEKKSAFVHIPKFNTFFIKFYFAGFIALISILTIFKSQNVDIINRDYFYLLTRIFSNSGFTLIPIISISIFIFLLIDRKLSDRLTARKS